MIKKGDTGKEEKKDLLGDVKKTCQEEHSLTSSEENILKTRAS